MQHSGTSGRVPHGEVRNAQVPEPALPVVQHEPSVKGGIAAVTWYKLLGIFGLLVLIASPFYMTLGADDTSKLGKTGGEVVGGSAGIVVFDFIPAAVKSFKEQKPEGAPQR